MPQVSTDSSIDTKNASLGVIMLKIGYNTENKVSFSLKFICWFFVENRSTTQNFWSTPCIKRIFNYLKIVRRFPPNSLKF